MQQTRIYFREQAWVARFAAAVLGNDNCAIVFWRTIYLHNIAKADLLQNEELFRHELTHVQQWQRLGIIRFPLLYLWYSCKFGYYENPYEQEARANESNQAIIAQFTWV